MVFKVTPKNENTHTFNQSSFILCGSAALREQIVCYIIFVGIE